MKLSKQFISDDRYKKTVFKVWLKPNIKQHIINIIDIMKNMKLSKQLVSDDRNKKTSFKNMAKTRRQINIFSSIKQHIIKFIDIKT